MRRNRRRSVRSTRSRAARHRPRPLPHIREPSHSSRSRRSRRICPCRRRPSTSAPSVRRRSPPGSKLRC
ncbi:hypothetical protein DF147_27685 [Burkholderia cenocepacia]|nr:hypothetical protein DF147_27685 [Burkholderia cenocepacia]RQV83334.1 hypothetical protein DF019_30125 [Burkholderia cenocepacia]